MADSTALSRDAILSADDLQQEAVHVPEWGGEVHVRALTAQERDEFEASVVGDDPDNVDFDNVRAKLLVRTIVDADGNRLFDESDTEALGRKSGKAVSRVFEVAQELSGIGEDEVDELVGN